MPERWRAEDVERVARAIYEVIPLRYPSIRTDRALTWEEYQRCGFGERERTQAKAALAAAHEAGRRAGLEEAAETIRLSAIYPSGFAEKAERQRLLTVLSARVLEARRA